MCSALVLVKRERECGLTTDFWAGQFFNDKLDVQDKFGSENVIQNQSGLCVGVCCFTAKQT